MVKIALTVALALLCLFLVKANSDALRGGFDDDSPPVKAKKVVKGNGQGEVRKFNPRVPRSLPNLYNGYLFNADRHMDGGFDDGAGAGMDARDEAPHVNVYEVSYNGSLLYGAVKKGLISYPLQKTKRLKTRSKSTSRAPKRASLQLEIGDKIGGYTVKAIEVERIIFSRGGEEVVKSLHDVEKVRVTARSTSQSRRKTMTSTARRKTPPPRAKPPSQRRPPGAVPPRNKTVKPPPAVPAQKI